MGLRQNSALPLDPDIVICLATGWSWQELMGAPAWVVDDLRTYLRKKGIIERERSVMLKGLRNGRK